MISQVKESVNLSKHEIMNQVSFYFLDRLLFN